jgi:PleD family two-component response regulator
MAIDLKYSQDPTTQHPAFGYDANLAPHAGLQPLSVLVIEDDPVDAAYLARILERLPSFKAEYVLVSEPQKIARALERFTGDIIIADLMLKGETSISFLSANARKADRIPVVLLTGLDGSNVQEMAFRAGVDAFISKSDLEPRLLETLVRTALHTADMRRRFSQMEYLRNRELCQNMARHSGSNLVTDALTGLRTRMGSPKTPR